MSAPLVARAPNHLGDLVMALPALRALGHADVVVPRPLAPLLSLAALPGTVLPLDDGVAGLLSAARRLRAVRYARGVLLTASFSSALLLRLGGVRRLRGEDSDGRGALLSERVPREALRGLHRVAAYLHAATGAVPDPLPAPRLSVPPALARRWDELLAERRGGATGARLVGLFPGGNAPSRRWPPERFGVLADRLSAEGARVVVFGGPGERALTGVAAGGSGIDLGGRTDLPLLAAGLAACDLVVSNDSGPLHLAAAVGVPTVSLWGAGDPRITGLSGSHHVLLRRPDLPCVPCVQNECPRRGAGTLLAEARLECLRLIAPEDVASAARTRLVEG